MYWNPRFIIGDLTKQSIQEVWNSPRALELAFPKKENFRDKSICKKCSIFDECYACHNKCYADVLKAYGDEKWDFPDPRCKQAPPFINELSPL
jgi:radical SAM protein with 4Fe4S-binding SPASM domain